MASYGRLSTEFYDLDKPEAPPDAAAYYHDRAARSGGRVLEPMCGSGRFLLPLLASGIAIDGVDASSEMLAACRSSAARRGLTATLHRQPLERLALPARYRFAFIPAGSLGLVHPRKALRAALRALNRHLVPGAPLVVELPEPAGLASVAGRADAREVRRADGCVIRYAWRAVAADAGVSFHGHYTLLAGDRVLAEESEAILVARYEPADFLRELERAGFVRPRADAPEADMAWLGDTGCIMYECEAAGGRK
ncbi:MAG: class I SAM-dependent methyltransferase [Burkholderiales bacterium]